MTPGLTSVLIPTYEHLQFVPAAINSALAQVGAGVEVVVVDDGSTDGTTDVLRKAYADDKRVRVITMKHAGPSAARNVALDVAEGEYVMFLDADDVITVDKVKSQLAEFRPDTGWVLCDVRIENEATGKTTTASAQYGYAQKKLDGWIQPLLTAGNFIPIMSPLIRRDAIGAGLRFRDELVPEDWHFWHALAGMARVRYVPRVLATYRHRRTGRSRLPKKARAVVPNIVQPLRLNLGCGTPDTRSWHPIAGMVNLDKSLGWRFEDGLGDFIAGSVAGITVSHSLMYVPEDRWPFVFGEFARVLWPGGVLRITEDDTTAPGSRTFGKGWQGSDPAVTLTGPEIVERHMRLAGLRVAAIDANTTRFTDRSLMQAQHGAAPDVFFREGVRENVVLFSPHNDDETLFAAFSIIRYRPRVVVCFPSAGDYGDSKVREAETREAVELLGGSSVEQWHGGDILAQMRALDERMKPTLVFAPSTMASHPDHVAVAQAAAKVFAGRLQCYHTYYGPERVRNSSAVLFDLEWTQRKLRALTRYKSQITHPRANQFFMADLYEYME